MNRRPFDMHAGPGLDRLFPIHLRDGRLCSVTRFAVWPAYLGILEGGMLEPIALGQRDRLLEIVRKEFGEPVQLLEPEIIPVPTPFTKPAVRLPWIACAVALTSAPIDPEMIASTLGVLWWQDSFEAPLPVEIEKAVSGVSWADCARDYELS
jgi:hypothetical protein